MEILRQPPPLLFASLAPDAPSPLPGLAYRQTLLLGLIPLGTALLLAAALYPDAPSTAFLATLAGGMVPLLLFAALWPWAMRRPCRFRGAGVLHYLVRCTPAFLTPALLWLAFHRVLHETAGAWPLILIAVALVLHPVSRILHETASPHLELARLWVRQTEVLLILLAILGLLSGAILEAHKDYPTDPTVLLLILWILGILLSVASLVLAAIQWQNLRGEIDTAYAPLSQPLDDPPPPSSPAFPTPLEFHTDDF